MAHEAFFADAAFCAACGFLVGILAASLGWDLPVVIAWVSTIALAAEALSFATALSQGSFSRRVKELPAFSALVVISVTGLFFGVFYAHFFTLRRTAEIKLPAGKSVSFSAIVSDEPKTSAKSLILTVSAEGPYSGTLTVFAPPGSGLVYGDEVRIQGEISPPEAAGDDPSVFPKMITLVAKHRGFWLREKLLEFKAAVFEKFNETLSPDEAALLGGEILGGTNGMSAGLKAEMSQSGT